MNKSEILILRRTEFPKTLRLLELFPAEKSDLRPAPKSRNALDLALTFLGEERVVHSLCTERATPKRASERPQTIAEAIAASRRAFADNNSLIEQVDDDEINAIVDFYGLKIPLIAALLIEFIDHIHHRGQFTIYSRLAGAKVPQICGPSADEPMMQA